MNRDSGLATTIILAAISFILIMVYFTSFKMKEENCESFRAGLFKDLPTRCIPYYLNPKEREIYQNVINK